MSRLTDSVASSWNAFKKLLHVFRIHDETQRWRRRWRQRNLMSNQMMSAFSYHTHIINQTMDVCKHNGYTHILLLCSGINIKYICIMYIFVVMASNWWWNVWWTWTQCPIQLLHLLKHSLYATATYRPKRKHKIKMFFFGRTRMWVKCHFTTSSTQPNQQQHRKQIQLSAVE